jgi:flagellin
MSKSIRYAKYNKVIGEDVMTSINTNVGALNARTNAINATNQMEGAMQRLSSGLRINSAADDAAGLAVAGKMESQLRGINMAVRNAQDGVGLIQTAESGLNEIRNMVLRIRELAVQMANGIYEDTPDRDNAQLEVSALISQVTLIADNTRFNDVNLIDGSFTGITIQAGNTIAETIELSFIDVTAATADGTAAEANTAFALTSTSDTGVTATGGSGSGATFTIATDGSSNITATLTAGSGYAVGDILTIAGADLTGGTGTGSGASDDIFYTVTGVGLEIDLATVATQSDATVAIGTMDTALQAIAGEQAKFGSLINRLNFSVANLSKASVMTEQAVGRIMDADFALETTNLSKQQILNQAATSMLAQANQSKQSILALLQ